MRTVSSKAGSRKGEEADGLEIAGAAAVCQEMQTVGQRLASGGWE